MGVNGMWLIKTKARAVLDHSHKSSVPIRGWQLNPVLVGSHWSSSFTSQRPFHSWSEAPVTHVCEDMFSCPPSPSRVLAHPRSSVLIQDKWALPFLCKAGMSHEPGSSHRFQLCQLCVDFFYCRFLSPGTQAYAGDDEMTRNLTYRHYVYATWLLSPSTVTTQPFVLEPGCTARILTPCAKTPTGWPCHLPARV